MGQGGHVAESSQTNPCSSSTGFFSFHDHLDMYACHHIVVYIQVVIASRYHQDISQNRGGKSSAVIIILD